MPYIIPSSQFKEIIDRKRNEITLTEVPTEKLKECVGFTYRWLPNKNVDVKVNYLPIKSGTDKKNFTVDTGINADLKFLRKCVERNPSDYYWMDCLCVPQDEKIPEKEVEISNMRLYYNNFKRVSFIGKLEGTSHNGNYKIVRYQFYPSNLC